MNVRGKQRVAAVAEGHEDAMPGMGSFWLTNRFSCSPTPPLAVSLTVGTTMALGSELLRKVHGKTWRRKSPS